MNTNDWKNLGKKIAGVGLPILGSVFGGPAGGAAGALAASALGLEDTPDNPITPSRIENEIQYNPDALAKLREMEMTNDARLQELVYESKKAELDNEAKMRQTDVDLQIAEVKSDDQYVRRTRPSLLRKLFWLVAIQAVMYHPLVMAVMTKWLELNMKELVGDKFSYDIFYYTCMLFGVGFTGYTTMRSMYDKQSPSDKVTPFANMISVFKKK